MNKAFLIGNLTRDPEVTMTNTGIAVCRMSIAVSRTYKNNDGEREVDYFNIVVWRTLGENCGKYLRKGSKVSVCGSIQNRSFEGQDGTKRYYTEIVAEDVEFLTPKSGEEESTGRTMKSDEGTLQPIEDDTLPF